MKRLPALLMLGGGFATGAVVVAAVQIADLSGPGHAPDTAQSRPPIRHVLPGMEMFGKVDASRLESRPIGTYVDVIETGDGKVLILDSGDNPVYQSDPADGSTVLVKDFVLPSITPRQAFEQPDDMIVLGREPAEDDATDAPAAPATVRPAEKL